MRRVKRATMRTERIYERMGYIPSLVIADAIEDDSDARDLLVLPVQDQVHTILGVFFVEIERVLRNVS